jgi:hypothetical protein
MARYLSNHALGCLPKPAFASLCSKLFATSVVRRIIAGQVGEKMLVEFDAADQTSADAWLRANKLTPLWVMRIDFESTDGTVRGL